MKNISKRSSLAVLLLVAQSLPIQAGQGDSQPARERYLLDVRIDALVAERGLLRAEEALALLEEARVLGDGQYGQEVVIALGDCLRRGELEGIAALQHGLKSWSDDDRSEEVLRSMQRRLFFRSRPLKERRAAFQEAIEKGSVRWSTGDHEWFLDWTTAATLALSEEMDELLPVIRRRVDGAKDTQRSGFQWTQLAAIELPLAEARQARNRGQSYLSLLEGVWAIDAVDRAEDPARSEITRRVCGWLVRNHDTTSVERVDAIWQRAKGESQARAKADGAGWRKVVRFDGALVSLLGAVRALKGDKSDEGIWRVLYPVTTEEAARLMRRGGVDDGARLRLERGVAPQ